MSVSCTNSHDSGDSKLVVSCRTNCRTFLASIRLVDALGPTKWPTRRRTDAGESRRGLLFCRSNCVKVRNWLIKRHQQNVCRSLRDAIVGCFCRFELAPLSKSVSCSSLFRIANRTGSGARLTRVRQIPSLPFAPDFLIFDLSAAPPSRGCTEARRLATVKQFGNCFHMQEVCGTLVVFRSIVLPSERQDVSLHCSALFFGCR
jgi:hypothetical protein